MTHYDVQYQSKQGSWFLDATFKPHYVMSRRRAFWRPWPSYVAVVNDYDQKNKDTLSRALNYIRTAYTAKPFFVGRPNVRIKRTVALDGHKTETIIWENGKWK